MRLDRWLWAARFYKSRSQAAEAAAGGHVQVGGRRAKPSTPVGPGDEITITKGELSWTVVVLATSERRGPASEAARLYREFEESAARRRQILEERRAAPRPYFDPAFKGRPTKRDRRRLERIFGRRR
ncbi:MAG: RNA-binding S4 domain-containing protein [Candidatus Dadabacteria bacterium]|nr:MAG: RNA-binding S4 domain-containing protein [Candidatus Dadabacteria bacterium]